jgi:hypothetical protein
MTIGGCDAARIECERSHGVCSRRRSRFRAAINPVVSDRTPVGVEACGPISPSCFDGARSEVIRNEARHDSSHVSVRAEVGQREP